MNLNSVKSIEPYTKTIGYPYKWCQILCGLYYINESDIKHKERLTKDDSKEKINEFNNGSGDGMSDEAIGGIKLEDMEEEEIDEIDNNSGDIFTYAATSSNKNEAKILQKVLHNLKSRFKSRVILQETINSLSKFQLIFI